jgi:uncharacterized protein DUF5678
MALTEHQIEGQKKLSRELRKYVGLWVAVRGDEVVATGNTPEAVLEQTTHTKIDRLSRVPSTSGSVLL